MSEKNKKPGPIRKSLAFAFLPNFRYSHLNIFQNVEFIRPLFLAPLIWADLIPLSAVNDKEKSLTHYKAAWRDLYAEIKANNWAKVSRKAPAFFAVTGLIIFTLLSLLTFLSALVFTPAHAQDITGFFEVPGKAKDLVTSIFGNNANGPAGNIYEGALGKMLFIFNTGMLFFGGCILIYQWAYLSVSTAEDKNGILGGERNNITWFIIRSAVAIPLLVPLPFGGFNGVQHIIIGLGNTGSSLATRVWSEFSEATIQSGRPVTTPRPPADIDQLVAKLLIVEACTISANAMAALAGDAPYINVNQQVNDKIGYTSGNSLSPLPLAGLSPVVRKQTVINYDGRTGALDRIACGQVKFPYLNENQDAITAPIITAQQNAFLQTRPAIIQLAGELSKHFIPGTPEYGTPMPDPGKLIQERGIIATWHKNILSAITDAKSSNDSKLNADISNQINSHGWVSAGALFQTIASLNGQFLDAASALPSITLPRKEIETLVPVTGNVLNGLSQWINGYTKNDKLSSVVGQATTALAQSETIDLYDLLLEYFDVEELILSIVQVKGSSPLSDLAAIGDILINTAMSGFVVLAAASFTPLINGAIFNYVGLALVMLLAPGAALSIWLPLLPFIRFIFGIVGWLLSLLEAVVLSSLFLLAHLNTRDSGLYTQSTAPGYQLIFSIVLRPSLMVFGLIGGYLIFNASINLFSDYFHTSILAANNGSSSGLIKVIFYIILYCITAYTIANMSFKAIDSLPEKALEWIGGRTQSQPDHTQDAGNKIGAGNSKVENSANRMPPSSS